MDKQRRSGHTRFKTTVRKALNEIMERAGFSEGERLFWRRDQHGNLQGIDFQIHRNEWVVNAAFHYGCIPGLFSWSRVPRDFGLLDFSVYWRPSGIGEPERWFSLKESTEQIVLGETESAIRSLESFCAQWSNEKALLSITKIDDLRLRGRIDWPKEWSPWKWIAFDALALNLAALATKSRQRDLARQYAQVALELTPYPWFKKRIEEVLGEKL